MQVLRSESGDEHLVATRWCDWEAFDSWVCSEEFRNAHGKSGGVLLSGHPKMNSYEVAVEREAGDRSSSPDQARSANS